MREVKMKIIDLSHHNGKVDFVKVKASGIDGVIIRTGFGIESPRQVDRRFEDYYKGAKAAGLMVGAYHFDYAKLDVFLSIRTALIPSFLFLFITFIIPHLWRSVNIIKKR